MYDLGRGMVNNIMYRYGVGVNMFLYVSVQCVGGVYLVGDR